MTANWRDRPAHQLRRNDIVLMHAGHLRVVTDTRPPDGGQVQVRLGTTWYTLPAGQMMAVDRKGSGGGFR
ncbi:hypothetical protein AB0I72_09385 [Nocardiopsis sp. NPDC049922]|uniref:hypothetical protein n=1 Tax=Nocardiopsis sp. NPDC049922 TaxID=3155157 RepID=UPI0033CDA2CB